MTRKLLSISALSLVALGGLAIASTQAHTTSPDCSIVHSLSGNSIKLENWFDGAGSGSGNYELHLRSISGANKINSTQRGAFIKHAGKAVLLGKGQFSAQGQAFEIKLNVAFNGKIHSCEETIDASI